MSRGKRLGPKARFNKTNCRQRGILKKSGEDNHYHPRNQARITEDVFNYEDPILRKIFGDETAHQQFYK